MFTVPSGMKNDRWRACLVGGTSGSFDACSALLTVLVDKIEICKYLLWERESLTSCLFAEGERGVGLLDATSMATFCKQTNNVGKLKVLMLKVPDTTRTNKS